MRILSPGSPAPVRHRWLACVGIALAGACFASTPPSQGAATLADSVPERVPAAPAAPSSAAATTAADGETALSSRDSTALHSLRTAGRVLTDSLASAARLQQALDTVASAGRRLLFVGRPRAATAADQQVRYEAFVTVFTVAARTAIAWRRTAEMTQDCEAARAAVTAARTADEFLVSCRVCPRGYEELANEVVSIRRRGPQLVRAQCGAA